MFVVNVIAAVVVSREPQTTKRVGKPEVDRPESMPVVRDLERVYRVKAIVILFVDQSFMDAEVARLTCGALVLGETT